MGDGGWMGEREGGRKEREGQGVKNFHLIGTLEVPHQLIYEMLGISLQAAAAGPHALSDKPIWFFNRNPDGWLKALASHLSLLLKNCYSVNPSLAACHANRLMAKAKIWDLSKARPKSQRPR